MTDIDRVHQGDPSHFEVDALVACLANGLRAYVWAHDITVVVANL